MKTSIKLYFSLFLNLFKKNKEKEKIKFSYTISELTPIGEGYCAVMGGNFICYPDELKEFLLMEGKKAEKNLREDNRFFLILRRKKELLGFVENKEYPTLIYFFETYNDKKWGESYYRIEIEILPLELAKKMDEISTIRI